MTFEECGQPTDTTTDGPTHDEACLYYKLTYEIKGSGELNSTMDVPAEASIDSYFESCIKS